MYIVSKKGTQVVDAYTCNDIIVNVTLSTGQCNNGQDHCEILKQVLQWYNDHTITGYY